MEGYFPNWSEEVFVIKRVKNSVLWTYVIEDLNSEKTVGVFYEKELQKANQNLELKKQQRKIYDNLFNSWIDKKDIIL